MTRLHEGSHCGPLAIDLSLVTVDLINGVEWSVGNDPLGSDHLPITITINGEVSREHPNQTQKFNYNKADRTRFLAELKALPINDQTTPSIDSLTTLICDNILAAAKAAIPCTKGESTRTRNNLWWNRACEEAVKTKQYYNKRYRRNCTEETHQEMCKAKIDCKRIIAQAKLEHWKTFILNLEHRANLGSVYKQIKENEATVLSLQF